VSFSAFIRIPGWTVCSASPELFFRLDGDRLVSRPMKGTAPRGRWYAEDAGFRRRLAVSEKDRAENLMIVDMVRNDLGRIARTGTVGVESLFDVERYPTVWQMTSTVSCRTDAGLPQIFQALFPPASVTGAPKIRTTEIIAEIEDSPRRLYTGAIGYAGPGRQACFSVAIRTVIVDVRRGRAEYGVGGGIVWDSRSANEYDECLAKARVLTAQTPRFCLLETLLWTPESGWAYLDDHIRRLVESADYFGFRADGERIRKRLAAAAAEFPALPRRVRLLVSRDGSVRIKAAPLTPLPSPFRICLARRPVDSRNPFLFHKTTNRRTYRTALRECPGYDDVLLWNERGEVTETTIASVFIELDGVLITPPVLCGLLPGIYRNRMVAEGRARERTVRLDELARCRRIILANSVRGEWQAHLTLTAAGQNTERKQTREAV